MKKAISLILTGAILASSAVTAFASQEVIEVYLNNDKIVFDTDPEIVNDRTFVPLRAIVEGFDAVVDWNGETQSITITKDGVSNYISIGDTKVRTESEDRSEESELEAAPYIKDDYTMVPLRFISEGFGMTVDWNGENREIYITDTAASQASVAADDIKYYEGFSFVPDFGKCFGIDAESSSGDDMYFYTNITDEQKSAYTELLMSLGFVQVDNMSEDTFVSFGYEKENEQVVIGSFLDIVFSVTVLHKRDDYTGEIQYYKDYPSVPDYGVINSKELVSESDNEDKSKTYEYKSQSATSRANEMLTYIDVLERSGFEQTDMTVSTMTLENKETNNTVIIDQGTEDVITVKITVK